MNYKPLLPGNSVQIGPDMLGSKGHWDGVHVLCNNELNWVYLMTEGDGTLGQYVVHLQTKAIRTNGSELWGITPTETEMCA